MAKLKADMRKYARKFGRSPMAGAAEQQREPLGEKTWPSCLVQRKLRRRAAATGVAGLAPCASADGGGFVHCASGRLSHRDQTRCIFTSGDVGYERCSSVGENGSVGRARRSG